MMMMTRSGDSSIMMTVMILIMIMMVMLVMIRMTMVMTLTISCNNNLIGVRGSDRDGQRTTAVNSRSSG